MGASMSSEVIVTETGPHYQQEIRAGAHRYYADEPASMGGADSGPAPFDFLMSALGACTSMTLRMYAERKGWAIGRIQVELSHEKLEEGGRKIDRIRRRIDIEGELSDEQRQRLLDIALKCPVHRALLQPMDLVAEILP